MLRATLCLGLMLVPLAGFAAGTAPREAKSEAQARKAGEGNGKAGGDVVLSGMSILGNDEAPKELVIVPWKSSQLGDVPGISRLLDDGTQPVDKDVFMRELAYYGLKTDDDSSDK